MPRLQQAETRMRPTGLIVSLGPRLFPRKTTRRLLLLGLSRGMDLTGEWETRRHPYLRASKCPILRECRFRIKMGLRPFHIPISRRRVLVQDTNQATLRLIRDRVQPLVLTPTCGRTPLVTVRLCSRPTDLRHMGQGP